MSWTVVNAYPAVREDILNRLVMLSSAHAPSAKRQRVEEVSAIGSNSAYGGIMNNGTLRLGFDAVGAMTNAQLQQQLLQQQLMHIQQGAFLMGGAGSIGPMHGNTMPQLYAQQQQMQQLQQQQQFLQSQLLSTSAMASSLGAVAPMGGAPGSYGLSNMARLPSGLGTTLGAVADPQSGTVASQPTLSRVLGMLRGSTSSASGTQLNAVATQREITAAGLASANHAATVAALLADVGAVSVCTACAFVARTAGELSAHEALRGHSSSDVSSGLRSRPYFRPADEWVVSLAPAAAAAAADEQARASAARGVSSESVRGRAALPFRDATDDDDARSQHSSDSDSAHVVPVPDDAQDVTCAVCGEPFHKAYDDASEAWVYRGAVIINGEYYHAACASLAVPLTRDNRAMSPRAPEIEAIEGEPLG